jgi:hypothetical protein
MAIDKAIGQAPLGLDENLLLGQEMEPDIEIEIEDPERVSIEAGGIKIEIEPDEGGDDFNANLAEEMDGIVEQLRACGFSPDFENFSGPGITMDFFDANSLVELTTDYLMALSGVIAVFYNFAEEHSTDPRLVAIGNQMQATSSVVLNDLYLLQAWAGF